MDSTKRFRAFLLILILTLSYCTTSVSSNHHGENQDDGTSKLVGELIDWMLAKGGSMDPRVEMRRWNPQDPTSYFGAFVNAPVKKGELLLKIPGAIKIQVEDPSIQDDWDYDEQVCQLSWMLKTEYELGDDSDYAPYINYLKAQPFGQIPAMWSNVGQHLLFEVQGDWSIHDFETQGEGEDIVMWLWKSFEPNCMFRNDTLNPFYIAMAVQRGYDIALIPVYDMLNHYNGDKVNSITRPSIYDKDGFGVYALRDLKAGEELFYSYHACPDCRDTIDIWGTPEMLRDFGFVEQYPHRFHLKKNGTIFVDEVVADDGSKSYVATCRDGECPRKEWVTEEMEYLQNVERKQIAKSKSFIPKYEYETIKQYHKALTVALDAVLPLCT
ncbi:unnamed protein product [Cylindrotheca closterium]|uniref:SET domain-containing protein n=1 Tax=Cylindrotheca closterium TaxID=2856 RepID=A0AAD2FQE5_9STRA|nr:unnamed protein product [Cylindrotheca closterium]